MLKFLTIKNYVLIDYLELSFSKGFSVITGETGAGKSILLGALGLILGKRADLSAIGDKDEKCVVEGVFDIMKLNLNDFFLQNDLEYESEISIRRILFPGGKSRVFINEIPVNLDVLKQLGSYLIDIHSQHQNLLIKDSKFQLGVIDSFANNSSILGKYQSKFVCYQQEKREYKKLVEKNRSEKQNLEFYQHQLERFEILDLENSDMKKLEKELEIMQNGSTIQQSFAELDHLLEGQNESVVSQLNQILGNFSILRKYLPNCTELSDRMNSVLIEVSDISEEVKSLASDVNVDPQRLEYLQSQMSILYQLFETFRVQKISELLEKKKELELKIENILHFDIKITQLEKEIGKQRERLLVSAEKITKSRKLVFSDIEKAVIMILKGMGMPHVQFIVDHKICSNLLSEGQDEIVFLFSGNLGQVPQELSISASGGEISRIMFALKSLLSQFSELPTIIFDEIDTGISGRIAEKMGQLMKEMGVVRQIVTISHLPQIAAKGYQHFLVEKDYLLGKTTTNIRQISGKERITEVAQMLSGETIGENALDHAASMIDDN